MFFIRCFEIQILMEIQHAIYNQPINLKLHNRVNENQFDEGVIGSVRFKHIACGREKESLRLLLG